MEFMLLFAFVFLVFLMFVAALIHYIEVANQNSRTERFEAFAENIRKNIVLVNEGGNGFQIDINLPPDIEGIDYQIEIDHVGNMLRVSPVGHNPIFKPIPQADGDFVKDAVDIKCNRIEKINPDEVDIDEC